MQLQPRKQKIHHHLKFVKVCIRMRNRKKVISQQIHHIHTHTHTQTQSRTQEMEITRKKAIAFPPPCYTLDAHAQAQMRFRLNRHRAIITSELLICRFATKRCGVKLYYVLHKRVISAKKQPHTHIGNGQFS